MYCIQIKDLTFLKNPLFLFKDVFSATPVAYMNCFPCFGCDG